VYAYLEEQGVRGLEIAPAQAFAGEADPFAPSAAAVSALMKETGRRDLELVSMQSLLSGVRGALLFGSGAQRERFELGLARAVALAGRLGIPNLVLGSPANRAIPGAMIRPHAEQIAMDLFRRVGDLCLEAKAKLALEPNAAAYGTNFLNTIGETIAFVRRVGHPAVSVNFDIGSLHMNGEMDSAAAWFAKAGPLVSHVHISEPHLTAAPRDASQFEVLACAILAHGYGGWFSIEMRAAEDDNLAGLQASVAACLPALVAGPSFFAKQWAAPSGTASRHLPLR
jgi:sugar phosphate isomerase/epimerase